MRFVMQPDNLEAADFGDLVRRGYESPDVDYKAPASWRRMSGADKAELVRDVMGMANASRPGWIIYGISEGSGGQWVRNGVDEQSARSFDPSTIGNKIRRYCDPEASFAVHRQEVDGRLYVAIRVAPFQSVPHICRKSHGDVLSEGAVYVRTAASETSKVQDAGQMRALLDRGIQIHADLIVHRLEELHFRVYGTPQPPAQSPPDSRSFFENEIAEARMRAGAP